MITHLFPSVHRYSGTVQIRWLNATLVIPLK